MPLVTSPHARTRSFLAWALLVVATALAGCAHVWTSVENPGDDWKRVETAHFRIHTNVQPRHYTFLATRLENMHRAIKEAFFDALETPPLDVLLVDETLFMEVVDSVDLISWFDPRIGKNGLIIIRQGGGDDDETTAGFGVATHIARFGLPHAPPWLHVGFAAFLESAIVRNDGVAYFGRPPESHAVEVLNGRVLPLAELERASWTDINGPENRRHYATSWAFVHYLAVGGSSQTQKDLFGMLQAASSSRVNGAVRLPIARYDDGFREYALRIFGVKPSINVFALKLGALTEPKLTVISEPASEVRELLRAMQAARAKKDPP
jgi:hypothetical protein